MRMNRKQAIERFNNYLLKIQQPYMYKEDIQAVKTAILSMDKLEKIEQIVKKELSSLSIDEMSNAEIQIRAILEQE